jgi:outer membrane lipoprotein carrier protein
VNGVLLYRPAQRFGRRARSAAVASAALWVATLAATADPETLARALQRKYDTVRDFTADFVHSYQGGVLRKTVTERGRLLVKKPGMMRWAYSGDEEKVFVSDGRKMYSYIPADKQVYVSSVPPDDQASTPALFLAGKGELLRDFVVSDGQVPPGAPRGSVALMLVPKRHDGDYDSLLLVVDQSTLQLRMLVTGDKQGGQSTFTFSNLKENVGLSDREFVFKIPRGVDVVTDSAR